MFSHGSTALPTCVRIKDGRWGRIYATTHLAGAAFRQRPVGLVAGVLSDGEMLPVCMAIVVASYPHLPDPSLGSVFLWYATRCPDHVIELALRVSADMIPKRLMEITVDLAITRSFQAGHEGRTGLHASVDGGDELCAKYESFGTAAFASVRNIAERNAAVFR